MFSAALCIFRPPSTVNRQRSTEPDAARRVTDRGPRRAVSGAPAEDGRPLRRCRLRHRGMDRSADLLHGGLEIFVGALRPVVAVEEFQREVAAETVVAQVAEELA